MSLVYAIGFLVCGIGLLVVVFQALRDWGKSIHRSNPAWLPAYVITVVGIIGTLVWFLITGGPV